MENGMPECTVTTITISSLMSDSELLAWIEEHRPEIRYSEYLPDNQRTENPWRIVVRGHNPWRGKTLRDAIERYIAAIPELV